MAEQENRRQPPGAERWVSFDQLRQGVGMEDILRRYGLLDTLRPRRKAREFRGLCPFPDHQETRPSFDVNITQNRFKCWGCGKQGNIFDFVRYMGNLGEGRDATRQAALIVQEWFTTGATTLQPSNMPPESPQNHENIQESILLPPEKGGRENEPLRFELRNLNTEHPYLKERGLNPQTIEHFGLGYYSGRGVMQGRIVIPIHNRERELVAYAGRWPGDDSWPEGEDKYKLPSGFRKSEELYNLHRAQEVAKEEGLVLVEGYFGVFKLWQSGFQNGVGLMGSSMSKDQRALLVDALGSNGRITLMMDGDDAGRRCAEESLLDLSRDVFVKAVDLPDGVQPDQLSEEEIRHFLPT